MKSGNTNIFNQAWDLHTFLYFKSTDHFFINIRRIDFVQEHY